MDNDLRRITRVNVCCRTVVQDRYGVWTGVTENVSTRGCQIVTSRLLRTGTQVNLTISSDLFAEELEMIAEVVWAAPDRLGLSFLQRAREGALTSDEWLDKVIAHGATPESASTRRVAPSVGRGEVPGPVQPSLVQPVQAALVQPAQATLVQPGRAARPARTASPRGDDGVVLLLRR